MMLATTDYGQIGTAIALVVIAFLQVWNNRKQHATANTIKDVHTLVNSNFGAQLRITSLQADRIASLTKDPQDQKVAEEAHRIWIEHQENQATVDSSNKPQLTAPEGQKPDNA
jgi:Na+/phosphate symporter